MSKVCLVVSLVLALANAEGLPAQWFLCQEVIGDGFEMEPGPEQVDRLWDIDPSRPGERRRMLP
jgi:hypothetical protein